MCVLNDASPYSDMMFFALLKMMLLPTVTMMRCLPQNVAKPRIIRQSRHHWALPNIICRRQTSFKKAYSSLCSDGFESSSAPNTKITRSKCSSLFLYERTVKRCVKVGKNSKKYTNCYNYCLKFLYFQMRFVVCDKPIIFHFTCFKRISFFARFALLGELL